MGQKIAFIVLMGLSLRAVAFTSSDSIHYIEDGYGSNPSHFSTSNWRGGGTCDDVPATARKAFAEAEAFTKSCPTARLAPGKKIAINDYSGSDSPTMYIFDQDGNCLMSTGVSWGSGASPRGSLKACSTDNSKQTPPGFHLTAPHSGGERFNESNSIGLAGLSGQKSLGDRGILIHATGSPGTGTTWGCSGVAPNTFPMIKSTLGYGSLVYNYFGSGASRECGSSEGFAPPSCQPEAQAVQASNAAWGNMRSRVEYQPSGSGSRGGNSRSRSSKGTR